ncbi:pentapeptide repeat-containing protein [Mesorhizobium opportunistum]
MRNGGDPSAAAVIARLRKARLRGARLRGTRLQRARLRV